MLLLRCRLLVPSSQMQPRIMQMRLHVAVAVKPKSRVRDGALGAHRTRLRNSRVQLGAGAAVAIPDGGTREIQERAPGAAAAPAGIVCFVDGAEVGFQPLAAFFAEGWVGDGVGEPVLGR
ncbi:hypothetical protein CNMCM5793_009259 [Aspergillus hiratsukae]|uniref:Uncharacterized protein n=1 Tax=Aspergillus hiratsukae TaxID=1194566 RepID=A0A8H6PHK9_9EURO|nr:hypothetical protein CNMCM5793_009259 [Aspergillus hiratsukae]